MLGQTCFPFFFCVFQRISQFCNFDKLSFFLYLCHGNVIKKHQPHWVCVWLKQCNVCCMCRAEILFPIVHLWKKMGQHACCTSTIQLLNPFVWTYNSVFVFLMLHICTIAPKTHGAKTRSALPDFGICIATSHEHAKYFDCQDTVNTQLHSFSVECGFQVKLGNLKRSFHGCKSDSDTLFLYTKRIFSGLHFSFFLFFCVS